MPEKLTALEYLEQTNTLSDRIDEETWNLADRALWAAYELLGMQGRVQSKAGLDQIRAVAIEILKSYPEGLPNPIEP